MAPWILAVVALLAGQAASQEKSALIKIASIDGLAANDEFTRNVEVMQGNRAKLAELVEAVKRAPDDITREALEAQIKATDAKLVADNAAMVKHYGYSLLRSYVRLPEKSEVFVILTEEERDRLPEPEGGGEKPRRAKVCALPDATANLAFQSAVDSLQRGRTRAAELQAKYEATIDPMEKAYAKGRFDEALEELNEANLTATKTWGFNLNRQYVLAIERSTLYVVGTADEAAAARESDTAKSPTQSPGSTK